MAISCSLFLPWFWWRIMFIAVETEKLSSSFMQKICSKVKKSRFICLNCRAPWLIILISSFRWEKKLWMRYSSFLVKSLGYCFRYLRSILDYVQTTTTSICHLSSFLPVLKIYPRIPKYFFFQAWRLQSWLFKSRIFLFVQALCGHHYSTKMMRKHLLLIKQGIYYRGIF